jgi:hypothetical protein
VLVGGYHRQAIAGLDKSTPLLVSSRDEKGPCGYFSMSGNLTELNHLSRRVFGRPVDLVYPAIKGQADVGKPMPPGATLVRSRDVTPESFHDKNAPLAGEAGLEDAVRQGLLRKATEADAEAWAEAVIQNSPQRDIPPVAGQERPKRHQLRIDKGYVVLKPFVYPSGLHGAHSARFIIPKGAPKPAGNPGHSTVYDFNTLNCQGPARAVPGASAGGALAQRWEGRACAAKGELPPPLSLKTVAPAKAGAHTTLARRYQRTCRGISFPLAITTGPR